MARLPDIDWNTKEAEVTDFLDPATLTPESLYRLQSETWVQGAEFERERIIKDLEANEHIWRERVALEALKALIKGEQK